MIDKLFRNYVLLSDTGGPTVAATSLQQPPIISAQSNNFTDDETLIINTSKSSFSLSLFARMVGPGLFIAIGYVDPGNWATGIRAGSQYEYGLLSVVFFSSILAWFLQILCIKLGVVARNDLAMQCRKTFTPAVNMILYVFAELAILATDLAEIIGSAIALKLLFGIGLNWGVMITAVDVLFILKWYGPKYRKYYEYFIGFLGLIVIVCFSLQLTFTSPSFKSIILGLIPSSEIFENKEMLFVTIGILGATVMPHNLYLHSSICKSKYIRFTFASENEHIPLVNHSSVSAPIQNYDTQEEEEISCALTIWYLAMDVTVALLLAFFVNAMIIIVSASAFYGEDFSGSEEIQSAYSHLAENVHPVAATLFAIALLASGQSSTITGTIAGQIVMSGFLDIKMKAWMRKFITRAIALIPAMITVSILGEQALANLLIISQVVLSCQLPFAVFPLCYFTSSQRIMTQCGRSDRFVNSRFVSFLAFTMAFIISILNIILVTYNLQN